MTEKEAKVYKSLIKQMRFRHPFSWKKYKNHVTIVAYLMDKIEEWDELIKINEEPILKFSENQSMKIVKCSGYVVQGVNLWKQDPYFHPFLYHKVDDILKDAVDASYEYIQVMLNMIVVDMNRELVNYINTVKEEIIDAEDLISDEDDDDDSEVSLITTDNSKLQNDQLASLIRMRNDCTAKRLIARNAIGSLKAIIAYDYLEIIRGIDIISERKRENKNIVQTLSSPEIKFIDPTSIKKEGN